MFALTALYAWNPLLVGVLRLLAVLVRTLKSTSNGCAQDVMVANQRLSNVIVAFMFRLWGGYLSESGREQIPGAQLWLKVEFAGRD